MCETWQILFFVFPFFILLLYRHCNISQETAIIMHVTQRYFENTATRVQKMVSFYKHKQRSRSLIMHFLPDPLLVDNTQQSSAGIISQKQRSVRFHLCIVVMNVIYIFTKEYLNEDASKEYNGRTKIRARSDFQTAIE